MIVHKAIPKTDFLSAAWQYPYLQKMAGISLCSIAIRSGELITDDLKKVNCKSCLQKSMPAVGKAASK